MVHTNEARRRRGSCSHLRAVTVQLAQTPGAAPRVSSLSLMQIPKLPEGLRYSLLACSVVCPRRLAKASGGRFSRLSELL